MTKGIEMTFNKKGRHLIFTYNGEQVAEIQNIRAKKLFPVVVFNTRAVFPVEIKYLEGPKSKLGKRGIWSFCRAVKINIVN